MKITKLCILFFSSISLGINALEIDEKLTCRFLKLSNSKKTVLINRGAEDGLVVGDHAKFFLTSGIIARGMVEKVSPSRSIWSLYRVVVPDELVDNKVVNLKIASPVKVTSDITKSLKDEPIEVVNSDEKKPVEESSDKDLEKISDKLNDEDNKELEEMGIKKSSDKKVKEKEIQTSKTELDDMIIPTSKIGSKTFWEVFGNLSVNTLSGTYQVSNSKNNSTSAAASFMDFSLGVERNFNNSSSFLKYLGIYGFINKRSSEEGDQVKSTTDWFQYGAGVNIYFLEPSTSVNKLIGYGTIGGGLGTTNISYKVDVGSTTLEDSPTKGSNMFGYLGGGAKYFVANFGFKVELDYVISKETFNFNDSSSKTRSLSGPKVQFGLSYRF